MNRSFILALLTMALIVMMSTAVYAFVAPHNFSCDNCHSKQQAQTPMAAVNGCLTCHSVSGQAARMPIERDAMSNVFGSYTRSDMPKKGSKSSHSFMVRTPYDVRAMVTDSTNSTLNAGYASPATNNLAGLMLCIRCHNAKSNANTGTSKPFLRLASSNDSLCLECHGQRNVTTANTGSHPVFYRAYSTVYKLNTTAFRRVPLNANPYNRTSDLNNYLSAGKIVCSTCHATHYADSSSSTLDNRSTASGFALDDNAKGLKGRLQDSKGYLLRTDQFGATSASINLCSNCHKETRNLNHNGAGQNIQCEHCHAAHVDYTGDASAPNLNLVRRDFSNMSTAKVKLGSNVKVIYNSATSLRFARVDNKGICQVCHTPTPGVAIHDVADTHKQDCLACHSHANGFSAASCNTCHGQPPMASYVGGPDGKASQSYTLDESMTPHAIHASTSGYSYGCNNCHYNGTLAGSHNTSTPTFSSVFLETAGSVGAVAGHTNVPADYNTTTKTCDNVYCHSNGAPRNGTITWKTSTPSWENGKDKIQGSASECTSCHENGATLNTNAHYKHVTSVGIKCSVCHSATVNAAGAIIDRTKHANGVKDVVSNASNTFNPVDASCTNSCHMSSTPVWTGTVTCGSCHAVPETNGAHNTHLTAANGPLLGTAQSACYNCHDTNGNGKHANGVFDLKTCTPCHPGATPTWLNPASVTCSSCHTGTPSVIGSFTAPLKADNATLGHGKYALATQCTACHDATKAHIGAGPTEKRLLVAGNGLCNTCHTTAAGKGLPENRVDLYAHGGINPFTHYTSADDLVNIASVRSDACAGCHDTHGTSNLSSIRTTINGESVQFTNGSTGFRVTVANGNGVYNGLCQVCHTKVKYFKRNAAPDLNHNGGKNCLNCHSHKGIPSAPYAFAPNGDCGTCHGYPPVKTMTGFGTADNYLDAKLEDYSGGGGAHSVAGHLPMTIVKGAGSSSCLNCHNDFNNTHNNGSTPVKQNFVNVVVDPKFKFNNASSIKYIGNSCSNVSCHFKPSPNWVTGN